MKEISHRILSARAAMSVDFHMPIGSRFQGLYAHQLTAAIRVYSLQFDFLATINDFLQKEIIIDYECEESSEFRAKLALLETSPLASEGKHER
jgi:hypothetical protein